MRLIPFISRILAAVLISLSVAHAETALGQFAAFDEASTKTVDHRVWDKFLGAYVRTLKDGRTAVDYGAVTAADKQALKSYIATLAAQNPADLSQREAMAYWINLYNALTIDVVLDNYPVKSIKNIFSGIRPGPWARELVTVNGVKLTLDMIEHGILRPTFKDNRVHYAVNCASVGCPNLATHAYTGATLDVMLDAGARAYINHPRGVSITNGKVTASSIYNWFKGDFGGDDASVIAHLSKYAAPGLKAELATIKKIDRYDYDWTLNDAK